METVDGLRWQTSGHGSPGIFNGIERNINLSVPSSIGPTEESYPLILDACTCKNIY